VTPGDGIRLDLVRPARIGLEEAVFAAGKSADQLAAILGRVAALQGRIMLTRLSAEALAGVPAGLRADIDYDPVSRTGIFGPAVPLAGPARVAVVTAGASDLPVAREASRTLRHHGHDCLEVTDVGVAGLWRLVERLPDLRDKAVVIAVAGMDAALPSVLGGLVAGAIIAVPTSVGYGVASGGVTALHAALASCAPGITVVNIDNGYGAACAALRILNLLACPDGLS
jgi:NCAIR mutase (PurE)-related protein